MGEGRFFIAKNIDYFSKIGYYINVCAAFEYHVCGMGV